MRLKPYLHLCIGLLLHLPLSIKAQQLLLNGGFEDENICLEYKVDCAPEAWLTNAIDVFATYYKDPNRSFEGSKCVSIQAGHARGGFKRTFIRSRLLCGLRKGNRYRFEIYVKSQHLVLDSIGIYFSSTDPLYNRQPIYRQKPSLYLADAKKDFLKDSGWQQVNLVYTAQGNESFVSIAYAADIDLKGETGIPMENNFFVYLDNVSLTPLSSQEKLCDDWQTARTEIYDQDERHEFLARNIRNRRSYQPLPVVLPSNSMIRVDTLVLQEILFAVGKADLQPATYPMLDSFCKTVAGRNVDSVIVEGHTDNTGSNEMNNRLSASRVQTVLNYFAGRAFVKPGRIVPRAWGEQRPVADNSTPEGRQRNRRVEVLVYIRE